MGRGTSKAGGGSAGGGKVTEQEKFIDDMVDAMTKDYSYDETPFSDSDLEAAVSAYAITHKGVDEDALLDTIRDKVDSVESAKRRKAQITNLEQHWKYGKAKTPDEIKVGDTIDGTLYTFNDISIAPKRSTGSWSGTSYDGTKTIVSADNSFKVTSIKKLSDGVEITANKLGGTSGTVVKKKVKNGVYLHVYGGSN